jgi:hypothetical protein
MGKCFHKDFEGVVMAGQSRTLKLSILADVDQLKKNLNVGSNEVEGFGSKLGGFAKKAGAAFAVAGAAAAAYAGTLLVDGVKSAIEDEAAQAKLATTLKNVTGATKDQISAIEDYVTQTALANGITDDVLRPSLDRLIRSTKDVTKAQELQQLALDISAGTGKDLAAVSEALGKAYDGNLGALKRLGVGIDDSIIKSKDFDAAAAALSKTFEGQASKQAETFQGKMARLTVAFDEAKETVGSYVLDALTPLLSGFVDKGIPAIQDFAKNLGETLGPAFAEIFKFIRDDLLPILQKWWEFLIDEVVPLIGSILKPVLEGVRDAFNTIKKALQDNNTELEPFYSFLKKVWEFIKTYLAPILGGAFKAALQGVADLVSALVTGFSKLVGFVDNTYNAIKRVIELIKNNPIVRGISNLFDNAFGGGRANGGSVNSGNSYLVGENGPELFVPNSNGSIVPNSRMGGTTVNINVSGAIDPIGTARSIANVLNTEATLSGTFTNLGTSRLVSAV